jgi:uncharacterized protein
MNQQERDQLNQLLKPLVEFKLSNKDLEAESLIRDAVARQPDAAYLLVQRVMLLEHALNNAKARIEELQKTGQTTGSFLGSDPWAQPASGSGPVPGVGAYQQPRYAAPAQAQYQPQPQAGSGIFGGGSSFLGNLATTAAGVAAGGFLFQGLENLFGHHNSGFGGAGFGGSSFGQQPFGEEISETTVINNYYGDDAGQQAADNSDYFNTAGLESDDSFADDSFADDSGNDSDWM